MLHLGTWLILAKYHHSNMSTCTMKMLLLFFLVVSVQPGTCCLRVTVISSCLESSLLKVDFYYKCYQTKFH